MLQLTLVKLRDLLREPEALFWVFAFPVLLSIALGIAFRTSDPPPVVVGVEHGPGSEAVVQTLQSAGGFRPIALDPEEARRRLRSGTVEIVVLPGAPGEAATYWFDPTRPDSRLA